MDKEKILIVDDNRDLADGLATVMSGDGYEAVVAYSGEEALVLIENTTFKVAILDIKMPGIDGIEVLDIIKRNQAGMHVVMMTAYPIKEMQLKALDKGAITTIRKPFDIEKLLQTIADLEDNAFIMVVDDDPEFCASIKEVLKGFHYNVNVVHNGRNAIEHIISHRTDVLILDLRLPVKSGLDLYRDIEKHGRSVPTIVVTGYALEEAKSVEILKSKSVTDYLLKPFEPTELLASIEAVLARNDRTAL